MEKAMAPHSSTLAWKIPWREEPGKLPSMGSQRVGHDWATFLSLFTFMHLRRQWQPTPVFLPGKSQGWGSLLGCRLRGRAESDTTEQLSFHFSLSCIGEGDGNPLQCSCLENPRDSRAWWAAIYGVTQSWTRLKWLSSRSIYSFLLVRYSCPLSAGVLHALLCLKVYSWCICGERCTPCPPTPLPSCSSRFLSLCFLMVTDVDWQY